MLTKTFKFIVFVVVLAVIGLAVASFITINSIEDAKKENEDAQFKIEELKDSLNSLESALGHTNKELADHETRIEKYQEIISAWSKATPNVNEAVERITVAFEEVAENLHLYPAEKTVGIEDKMMDALYGAIRSTDPVSIAKDFETMVNKLNDVRYDNIMRNKIAKIEQNGVTFPEDKNGIEDLRAYYESFTENIAVMDSFVAMGLNKELETLEGLLDKDEEDDLAKVFENAVQEIKTPVLPTTSLTKANDAWSALCVVLECDDILGENTQKARELLDFYFVRVNELIHLTNSIRAEIDRIHTFDPDVTHEEIDALNILVESLLSFEVTVDVLNTEKMNYVDLLNEARLLPHKNEAFEEVKMNYDAYYEEANGNRDILIALVEIKDAAFNAIETAKSVDEIKALVKGAKFAFAKYFE